MNPQQNENMLSNLEIMIPEVFVHLCSYLKNQDVVNLRLTSSSLKDLVDENVNVKELTVDDEQTPVVRIDHVRVRELNIVRLLQNQLSSIQFLFLQNVRLTGITHPQFISQLLNQAVHLKHVFVHCKALMANMFGFQITHSLQQLQELEIFEIEHPTTTNSLRMQTRFIDSLSKMVDYAVPLPKLSKIHIDFVGLEVIDIERLICRVILPFVQRQAETLMYVDILLEGKDYDTKTDKKKNTTVQQIIFEPCISIRISKLKTLHLSLPGYIENYVLRVLLESSMLNTGLEGLELRWDSPYGSKQEAELVVNLMNNLIYQNRSTLSELEFFNISLGNIVLFDSFPTYSTTMHQMTTFGLRIRLTSTTMVDQDKLWTMKFPNLECLILRNVNCSLVQLGNFITSTAYPSFLFLSSLIFPPGEKITPGFVQRYVVDQGYNPSLSITNDCLSFPLFMPGWDAYRDYFG